MSFSAHKKYITINNKKMAYIEKGSGDPIIFLHGNPTSSYLWRNIIPALENSGRCIAPDLIGMGDSEKLDHSDANTYTFEQHKTYLEKFLSAIGVKENVTLVIHDWGSALGFDWANRNREKIKAIAYMEGIVSPINSWDDWPEGARDIFQQLRSPAGDEMILNKNLFIEAILPSSILRTLNPDEMDEYRRPFLNSGEDRRPTLTWPRQIPIEGEPKDVSDSVASYAEWMAENELPKLFINAKPGAILIGRQREFCRSWKNQTEVTVTGSHFIQEDSPNDISAAILDWYNNL